MPAFTPASFLSSNASGRLESGSNWRNKFPSDGGVPEGRGGYKDIKGFCNAASVERVKELDYVLTPGRYVGLADEEDDFDFNERFTSLKAEFEEQLKEESVLNKRIAENLAKIDLPVRGTQTGLKDE